LLKNDFPDIQKVTRRGQWHYGIALWRKNQLMSGAYFLPMKISLISFGKGYPEIRPMHWQSWLHHADRRNGEKYFGNEDPMNKSDKGWQSKMHQCDTFKPLPINSHIHPEILLSFSTLNDSAVYGEATWINMAIMLLPTWCFKRLSCSKNRSAISSIHR
jgi:putative ABC transport system permease protein